MMLFVLIAITLAFLYLYHVFTKKSPIPSHLKEIPIERGLPIIGILHKMKPTLPLYLKKLGDKYGSMFRIRMGMRDVLVLNEHAILKKALSEKGHDFSGRWANKLVKIVSHDSGILFTYGEVWSKQRSFVLKVLRDFGLGKSRSLEIVQNESTILLEELEKFDGQKVDFSEIIPIYTMNIISKFLMNKRFSREDPKIATIEKLLTDTTKRIDFIQILYLMFPILDNWEMFAKCVMHSSTIKQFTKVHMMIKEEIDEHSRRLDLNSEGEDLIDRFLIEQNQRKQITGSVKTFTDWQLIRNSFELFIAGYETTSTTLGWSMMFMARYPEIQSKVYLEIVNTIGTERPPTMNDKKALNYTQAVMDEILRLSTVAPVAIFHQTLQDTSVDGFFVPKNTLVIPNLLACHTNPKVWEKPMEFYPEHFLKLNDGTEAQYTPREELILFGIGKRQCLGESLARMEYLIFFLRVLQRFEVSFAEEVDDKMYADALIGNDGFIRFAAIKDFTFKQRK